MKAKVLKNDKLNAAFILIGVHPFSYIIVFLLFQLSNFIILDLELLKFVNLLWLFFPYYLMGEILKKLKIDKASKLQLSIIIPLLTSVLDRLIIFGIGMYTYVKMGFASNEYDGSNLVENTFNMSRTEVGLGYWFFFILPLLNILLVFILTNLKFVWKK